MRSMAWVIMPRRGSRRWIICSSRMERTMLARFTTDANAAGAKQYLAALSASLKTKAAGCLQCMVSYWRKLFKNIYQRQQVWMRAVR